MTCKKLQVLQGKLKTRDEANQILLDALSNTALAVDQANQKYKLSQDSLNKSELELESIKHTVLEYRLKTKPTEKDTENLLTTILRILRIR